MSWGKKSVEGWEKISQHISQMAREMTSELIANTAQAWSSMLSSMAGNEWAIPNVSWMKKKKDNHYYKTPFDDAKRQKNINKPTCKYDDRTVTWNRSTEQLILNILNTDLHKSSLPK